MRRTPAEYHVRHRLVRDLDMPVEQLIAELAEELVFVPGAAYLTRLRNQMTPPDGFRPQDLRHVPSQRFLREHGLRTAFQPHRGTREAVRVFEDVRSRMAIQTLIVSGADTETIVKVAGDHLEIELSEAGLADFTHYFWNLRLLTKPELASYIRDHLDDREMARIAAAPPGPMTVARAFAALGIPLPPIDDRRAIDDQMATVRLLGAAYASDMERGPAQAAAIRNNIETLIDLRAVRAEIRRDDATYEDSPYDVRTVDFPMPNLSDLAQGRAVPYPLGLLTPHAVPDAKPEAVSDDKKKPAAG